jgi:hypothetical protein
MNWRATLNAAAGDAPTLKLQPILPLFLSESLIEACDDRMSSMYLFLTLVIAAIAFISLNSLRQRTQERRLAYIRSYHFGPELRNKFKQRRPELDMVQVNHVFEGLRDWFEICTLAKRRMVAMPSQAVDDAWHEFILFTRAYQEFCKKALGRFLHHTPAEAMRAPTRAQEGIRRAWRLACNRELIHPGQPKKLPRIFAMDAKLGILGGFYYALNCAQALADPHSTAVYCGSDIGCASGCSGDSGASSDSGSGSDASSSGDSGDSGCSGGCSGGCGGGGD